MNSKDLLAHFAAVVINSQWGENYFGTPGFTPNPNIDYSHNVNPYHERPIRKGAGKKKLSKKQRKQLNKK